MKHYVVGFLFTPSRFQLALIRKARPTWQVGKLNGIGGHIEDNENSIDAIRREFQEETDVYIHEWKHYCTIVHSVPPVDWKVYFFKSFIPLDTGVYLGSPTDEKVRWYDVWDVVLRHDIVPNLRWLIPMALEDLTANEVHQHNWTHDN